MTDPKSPIIQDERVRVWLAAAEADADRRGLPEVKPALRLFAQDVFGFSVQYLVSRRKARPD